MALHKKNENKLPDSCFETGTLNYIVPGNRGRVLDGRRTPGFIEKYDNESAMFIWRITDFENKGKHWEVPGEEIVAYQFKKDSKQLTEEEVINTGSKCKLFSQKQVINGSESEYKKTLIYLRSRMEVTK